MIYSAFPGYKEYINLKDSISQVSLTNVNETVNITAEASSNLSENIEKCLRPSISQMDDLRYKPFEGERPDVDSKLFDESELRLSYAKFPTHAEYAKSISGLMDSQSLEDVHNSETNDNSSSSLPDIVNELKNRKILEHSFEEAEDGKGDNLEDILSANTNQKYLGKALSSATTQQVQNTDGSLSDVLGHDLNNMGLAWATAEMKKSKAASHSISVSSDSSNHCDKPHQSPIKQRQAKRSFQKMNQSKATNDSFVDKNIVATNTGMNEGTTSTQQTGSDLYGKSMNLKEFIAREIHKHSSVSSSDSSLASYLINSILGGSSIELPGTPNNRGGIDKHRTSTPVDHSSDGKDSSKRNYKTSSINKDSNKNQTESPTFFSNESQISSVRMNSTDSNTSDLNEERKK